MEFQLKNTSLKALCWMGRADLPSLFVVSENMVILAGPKHGDDLWPGRNLGNIFRVISCGGGESGCKRHLGGGANGAAGECKFKMGKTLFWLSGVWK